MTTQPGITPPAPGLEKEEPDLWHEDDIPSDDGTASASDGKGGSDRRDSRDADSRPERGERDD